VVATAVKLVSRQASEHGILMEVAVDPEIIIRADERALKQIAINLLSNAVKFCRDGGRVRVVAGSTEEGGVKLSVSDTGVGIAAKNIERALTPFSQIDEPVTRKSTGSGLGLALVKSLTELHGGRLIIDSVVGSGTTVRCLFPPSRVAGRRAA
jgi:signal transduction histidine kinase